MSTITLQDLLVPRKDAVWAQPVPLTALGHQLLYSQVGGKPPVVATRPTTPPVDAKPSSVLRERGAANLIMTAAGEATVRLAARQIADTLRKHHPNTKIQIYTSYWDRARRTADILQDELRQWNPLVKYVDNLAPQSLGSIESRPTSEVKSTLDTLRTTKTDVPPPGVSPISGMPGETTDSYRRRILPEIAKLMVETSNTPTLLDIVAAHSSDIRLVRAWVEAGYKPSLALDPKYMRSGIREFQVDGLMNSGGKWFYRTNVLPRVQDFRVVFVRHGDTPFQGK
jgi:broad specificity phosphatase PhoE